MSSDDSIENSGCLNEINPPRAQESEEKLSQSPEKKRPKKKYFDKSFKLQLAKFLAANAGEAGCADKMAHARQLQNHPKEKILHFTSQLANDVQKFVTINLKEDPHGSEISNLTEIMNDLADGEKPQELPLVMKLNSNNEVNLHYTETEGVNFAALNKFLYSAINGSVDFADLNEPSKQILYETYDMLMQQVDKDAPNYLPELKLNIGSDNSASSSSSVANLAEIFKSHDLNPMNLPFEFLLNGELPNEQS